MEVGGKHATWVCVGGKHAWLGVALPQALGEQVGRAGSGECLMVWFGQGMRVGGLCPVPDQHLG